MRNIPELEGVTIQAARHKTTSECASDGNWYEREYVELILVDGRTITLFPSASTFGVMDADLSVTVTTEV